MTEENKKPDCYKCTHRGNVPGDAHSCCKHPKIEDDPMGELFALMGIGAGLSSSRDELNIRADSHGVKQGWFIWPVNFDPIWLTNCDGFEEKV